MQFSCRGDRPGRFPRAKVFVASFVAEANIWRLEAFISSLQRLFISYLDGAHSDEEESPSSCLWGDSGSGTLRLMGGRPDVLIDVEQIGRIILVLDG